MCQVMIVNGVGTLENTARSPPAMGDVEGVLEPLQKLEVDSDPELSCDDEPDSDSDGQISMCASPRLELIHAQDCSC